MKKVSTSNKNQQLINQLLSGTTAEKFHGKQVVVIGGRAHILPDDDQKTANLVNNLEKKHPNQIPHFVFVPRPETYILILSH